MKDNGSTKGKDEGANLARQDSYDFDYMVVPRPCRIQDLVPRLRLLNHMTGRKVWLVDFDESKKKKGQTC